MKLIGAAMVSNEADVIEAFVRHNLRLLDALVVLDHRSIDATGEILGRLAAEGLPLVVLKDEDRAFRQGERITMMARRYLAELPADFCFALDADEFLVAPSRAALEAALGRIPEGAVGVLAMRNYVARDTDDAGEPHPMRRLPWRLREEGANTRKVVVGRSFAGLPDAQVTLGNHAAVRVQAGAVVPLRHVAVDGPFLAHYPVRGADQVAKKVLLGWLGTRLWRPEIIDRPGQASPSNHWRRLYRQIAAGQPVDGRLRDAAMCLYAGVERIGDGDLVRDPLEPADELRYTGLAAPSALATLATWTESFVEEATRGRS